MRSDSVHSDRTTCASIFRFRLAEIGRHSAESVILFLKYTKIHILVYLVFRAQGTCLVAANVPRWGANSASPNPLAGFEGPLRDDSDSDSVY